VVIEDERSATRRSACVWSVVRWRTPTRCTRPAIDPQPKGAPGRPNYRDRSQLFPVALQILREVAEGHDWSARWRTAPGKRRRCQPALAHRFGQKGLGEKRAAACLRRNDFCHDATTIGHEHDFTARGEANLFAESVLENLKPDSSHADDSSYRTLPLSIDGRRTDMVPTNSRHHFSRRRIVTRLFERPLVPSGASPGRPRAIVLGFQLRKIASLILCLRHRSAVFILASYSQGSH